jgi:murein DD-endopeptidase MepM/ murein hydrolase activator NlpD
MPGWIPASIGLQGMLDQVTASSTPSPTPSSPGSLPPGWQGAPPSDPGGPDPLSAIGQWIDQWNRSSGLTAEQAQREGSGIPASTTGSQSFQWPSLTGDPTTQLAQAIAQKMGVSLGATRDLRGAATQRQIYSIAQRAQVDGGLRQQLATYLGWNSDNQHVQYWVQSGGGLPSNPTATDAPKGGPGTGTTPSPNGAAAQAAGTVPFPFPYSMFNQPGYSGYNYGDPAPPNSYKSGWHEGQDYGVPANTAINSPFYGKIKNVGYDPAGYGSYVDVQFGDQGMYLRFAHLQTITVKVGDTVQPGEGVGISGSTGYSTGPHLLVELRDAQGRPRDPRPLLNEIYGPNGQGISFASLQSSGLAQQLGATGTVVSGGYPQPGAITTPDGHVLFQGSPDYGYYQMIDAVYRQYYANDPPYSIVMAMRAAGVTNEEQMRAIAATWPSDIPNVSFGQRDNIYTTANGLATKQWGRPIPDSMVKMLAQQGLTTPDDIKLWFDSHMPAQMPVDEYQQLYDAAAPNFQTTYGEPPNPAYIGYLWGQASTPPATVAGTTPATTAPAKVGA